MRARMASVALTLSILALARPAGAAGLLPPANPAFNIVPEPNFDARCVSVGGVVTKGDCAYARGHWDWYTARREADALRAIDAARAREGLGPLVLPRDWAALDPAEQQFVLVDLERVDRGLPPILGLSRALDALAAVAAARGTDPNPVGTPWGRFAWAANWASDWQPAPAVYDYMYFDGWNAGSGGSWNVGCVAPLAPRCWDHRDNILGAYGPTAIMGIGIERQGRPGSAQLFVAYVGPPVPLYYTWAEAVQAGADRPGAH